jgi:hypothetical protein
VPLPRVAKAVVESFLSGKPPALGDTPPDLVAFNLGAAADGLVTLRFEATGDSKPADGAVAGRYTSSEPVWRGSFFKERTSFT